MDIKECYRLTHPLSKISGYATGMEDWSPKVQSTSMFQSPDGTGGTESAPRGRKRNHFSFMDKSFNTQCNLTKSSTLIVSEYYIDVTYLISDIH